jgi:hypothetical protein
MQAQRAGIEDSDAKGQGYRGRKPSYTRDQLQTVPHMVGQPAGIALFVGWHKVTKSRDGILMPFKFVGQIIVRSAI